MKNNKVLAISVILILLFSAAGLTYTNVLARPSGATSPGLGAAGSFSALAALSAASNNTTTLGGNLGLSPGVESDKTGPWIIGGSGYYGPLTLAADAQSSALGAYNNLRDQGSDGTWSLNTSPAPGVWTTASSATFAGTLTLNGGYDDVWIFQVGESLTFDGSVVMSGNAQACHVFWQVGENSTIGSGASFIGTLITENDITLVSGANVSGRVLSLVGALTTDNNNISMPPCAGAAAILPDNPQPESGSTEAFIGTATANALATRGARAGVPSTGGADLQNNVYTWLLVGIGLLSIIIFVFAIRKIRQIFGPK